MNSVYRLSEGQVFEKMRAIGRTTTQGPFGEWFTICYVCEHTWVELNPDFQPTKCSECGALIKHV